nr:FimV/HubP family polar landmark protein [Gammaproteobacteria bacterium]
MPRLLFVAVSALAGILPVSVFALGLGEISLKSALNQPFNAEIPVTSESTDDLSQLNVSLASSDTFDRFGLLRPRFLSDFEFDVVTERGRTVIRATSTSPVVEPFVTLLLEIDWPQGRLLREYTVLLDPPVYDTGAPVAAAPQAQPDRAAPAPTRQEPTRAPTTTAPVARPSRPAPTATGGNYGPVQRNDTLWAIAERVRPDTSIDMNQMMLAIYRANPEAFAGNINRLRAGAILRLPDSAELESLSRRDAFTEVRRQNEEWRGAAPTRAADSARLRLVPPGSDTGVAADGEQQAMVPPSVSADTADMQAQIADLQSQLRDRDRLLELRSQELQDLQNQLEALRAREAELTGEAPVAEPIPEPAPEPAPVAEVPAPTPAPTPETAPETTPPATTGLPPAVTTTVREEPSMISQLLSGNWLYIIIGVAAALLLSLFVARGRRKAAAPVGEWGDLLDEEAEAEKVADTAQISPPGAADETFVVEEAPPAADTDQLAASPSATMEMDRTGDQEAPLEKTLSSDAALNLDQADPIAEAEFHMAYGLYDQAADLLQDALKDEPERRDLRRKLIDVYFVWENRGGFLREAQAFREQVGDQDAEWNKVLIMGKQLCPEEELFAAAPTAVSADEAMDLALDEELGGDVDLQLGDDDAGVDLELSAIREGPDADSSRSTPASSSPSCKSTSPPSSSSSARSMASSALTAVGA